MHLAVMSWGAVMMGMSGHDLRTFHMLRQHLDATSASSMFEIDSNGMTSIDVYVSPFFPHMHLPICTDVRFGLS